MKKSMLFIIPSLTSGGAEKALISFFLELYERGITNDYDIDLILFQHKGLFINMIPEYIRLVPIDETLELLYGPFKNLFSNKNSLGLAKRLKIIFIRVYAKVRRPNFISDLWELYKNEILDVHKKYDIAISYLQGTSTYFLIDKINADYKIGWLHSTYSNTNFNLDIERKYLDKLNTLYCVSEPIYQEVHQRFEDRKFNIKIMQNIISVKNIKQMAQYWQGNVFQNPNSVKVVTVGRLEEAKGYDVMLEAIKIFRENHEDFELLIVGEGTMYNKINNYIKTHNLQKNIKLIGATSNPYAYINQADVYIQTSKYEGYGIAIAEARILGKPVLLTNFNCAHLHVVNENGLIVENTPNNVAIGLNRIINNYDYYKKNAKELNEDFINTDEVLNFMNELGLDI